MNVSRTTVDCEAPPIAAVPAGVQRPLWSVMIPTFNCAKYLRVTLESVLQQDPGPDLMQIEVVDDCSTKDDPEAVVKEMGKGRVLFHRKPQNGGAIANFNTCIERSRGELVHILHGDDAVMPGFYSQMERLASRHPDVAMYGCRSFIIDVLGVITDVSTRIQPLEAPSRNASCMYYQNPIRTPSAVIRRSFYETYGGFNPSLVHTADWDMWVRATHIGACVFIPDVLCHYRVFSENDTSKLVRTAENLLDAQRFYSLMRSRHPDFDSTIAARLLEEGAVLQLHRFLDVGDAEASAANLAFYRTHIPLVRRARRWAARLVRRIAPR